MGTISDLAIRLSLTGADKVKAGLVETSGRLHAVGDAARSAGAAAVGFATALGIVSAASAAMNISTQAFNSAVSFDSLTRGLASVSVNAADLTGQLSRLQEVAKLPGLGFEEAIRGSISLQSAGLSATLAERSLMAFGNALGSVGKGKADLEGVSLALSQIMSKGKVSAEEINQINERVPQIRAAMTAAFGTSDTEALQKQGIGVERFIDGIVTQLEKLPKVTGGIGNAIENASDAWKMAILPLGQGIAEAFMVANDAGGSFFSMVTEGFTQIGQVIAATARSGILGEMLGKIGDAVSGIFSGLADGSGQSVIGNIFAGIITVAGNIPAVFAEVRTFVTGVWDAIGERAGIAGEFISATFNALLPRIGFIGTYLGDVMHVAMDNIGKAFDYASARMGVILNVAKQKMQSLIEWAAHTFTLIGESITGIFPAIGKGLSDAGGAIGSGLSKLLARFDKAIPGANIPKPQFGSIPQFNRDAYNIVASAYPMPDYNKAREAWANAHALPSIPNIGATAFQGYGNNNARLQQAIQPLAALPDGLNYRGAQTPTVDNSGAAATLERIEKNTGRTADALSLRRQAMGGGVMGQLGVTPQELVGTGAGNIQRRSRSSGFLRDGSAQKLASNIEAMADKRFNKKFGRANGGGFRP